MRQRLYWTLQIGGWYGHFLLINIVYLIAYPAGTWRQRLGAEFAYATLGIVVTHVYRWFVRMQQWTQLPLARLIPLVLFSTLPLAVFYAVLLDGIAILFDAETIIGKLPSVETVIRLSYNTYLFVVVWATLYFAEHYFQHYKTASEEKMRLLTAAKDAELHAKDAQMRALVAQLNPHFIFNCMNGIMAEISEQPAHAKKMVTELAQLLRHNFTSSTLESVPLKQEIEAVRAYLRLEQVRFEERLLATVEVAESTLEVRIPPMLLQTVVENSIKHGIAKSVAGGEVRVSARAVDGRLLIEVMNTGKIAASADSTRVGLENARQRLRLLHGADARITLENAEGMVRTQIEVPMVSLPSAP